jgi:hypothetical protein
MIVKSMSRKVPSFGQLIGYIDRDEGQERWRIRHNVMARDPDRIRGEFEQNGALLSKRKNGVYLYHEIISITRARGLSEEEQKARLQEIAETYVASRCPDNLVYGGLHQDKEHSFHYHLMISANRAGDSRRLRLSKAQFREVQVQLERHVLQAMPELEQKVAIDKRAERRKSRSEAELERRTGEVPKKDQLRARVREALEDASDRDALLQALGRSELELYVRGKTLGVIDLETGAKHRLKTLDLELLDRVEAVMQTEPEPREKTASAGEKEKASDQRSKTQREDEAQSAERAPKQEKQKTDKSSYVKRGSEADLNRGPDSQPLDEPEQEAGERTERQKAWRDEISKQRESNRDTGSERDRD